MFFDRYCWSGVFMNGALADLECCVLISDHQISVTMINLIKSSGLPHPSDLRLKMMDQEEGREDNAINWKPLFFWFARFCHLIETLQLLHWASEWLSLGLILKEPRHNLRLKKKIIFMYKIVFLCNFNAWPKFEF